MTDITGLLTPEIISVIRLAVIVFSLFHLGIAFVLNRQVAGVARLIHSRHVNWIKLISLVHILALAGILLYIILVN